MPEGGKGTGADTRGEFDGEVGVQPSTLQQRRD